MQSMKMHTRELEATEAIASKDRNNLTMTSSFFRNPMKYRAFCAYYAIKPDAGDSKVESPSVGKELAT